MCIYTKTTTAVFILIAALLSGTDIAAQVPGSTMSCTFKGKIVCVCKDEGADKDSPCAKYPCKAHVEILEVLYCGSSVTRRLIVGDTVEMNFAYTLHKTKKIFPKMKEKYPGLKRKKTFKAEATQTIIPGGAAHYTVHDYTKL